MKMEPVDRLPERRQRHDLRDFIEQFIEGPDEVVRIDFTDQDYKTAQVCYHCLHAAGKRSRHPMSVHIRGKEVYLVKRG